MGSNDIPKIDVVTSGDPSSPPRLGGWLLVFAVILMMTTAGIVFQLNDWLNLAIAGFESELLSGWPGLAAVAELLLTIALLIVAIITMFHFFRRTAVAPTWCMSLLLGTAIYGFATAALFSQIYSPEATTAELWADAIGAGSWSAIWIAYFLRSKRVARTFIGNKERGPNGRGT